MRDGERRECPVVSNESIKLRYGEGEDDMLFVAATHDSVQMFPDPKYNYLRYFDAPERQIIAVFLAQEVLADLVENGIPLCMRSDITELEVEVYESHIGKLAVAASGMMNCIEVEEAVDATLTDAEIAYFMGEWDK